jgi:hypothetical protein
MRGRVARCCTLCVVNDDSVNDDSVNDDSVNDDSVNDDSVIRKGRHLGEGDTSQPNAVSAEDQAM